MKQFSKGFQSNNFNNAKENFHTSIKNNKGFSSVSTDTFDKLIERISQSNNKSYEKSSQQNAKENYYPIIVDILKSVFDFNKKNNNLFQTNITHNDNNISESHGPVFNSSSIINNLFESVVNNFSQALTKLSSFLNNVITGNKESSYISTISAPITKFFSAFSYRASGGNVNHNQPFIVGEKRPELFIPRTNGFILPFVPKGKRQLPEIPNSILGFRAGGGSVAAPRAVRARAAVG